MSTPRYMTPAHPSVVVRMNKVLKAYTTSSKLDSSLFQVKPKELPSLSFAPRQSALFIIVNVDVTFLF